MNYNGPPELPDWQKKLNLFHIANFPCGEEIKVQLLSDYKSKNENGSLINPLLGYLC